MATLKVWLAIALLLCTVPPLYRAAPANAKDAPPAEDTPAAKDAPAAEDAPTAKDAPPAEDAPPAKDEPASEDAPAARDAPAAEDAPEAEDSADSDYSDDSDSSRDDDSREAGRVYIPGDHFGVRAYRHTAAPAASSAETMDTAAAIIFPPLFDSAGSDNPAS